MMRCRTRTGIMLRSPARVILHQEGNNVTSGVSSSSSTMSAPATPVHHGGGGGSTTTTTTTTPASSSSRLSLLDTCHRKIRLFGELVA
ncbi:MOB kinase activator-like 2 isoform X1 [Vespula maculifrons]|uniref:MOB kinase activator-like 2 isoform X1 n=1 Tax=Vespula maculifrons TaxID=7453 RepID=A0ABD2AGP9_VESMC